MTPEQAAVVRRAGDAAHNAATERLQRQADDQGAAAWHRSIGAHDESARPTYFNGLRAQALADVTNLATDSDDDLRRALAWLQIQADALEPLRAAMTGDPPALEQATQRANALLARLDPLPPDDQFGIHVRNGQFARAFSAEYDRLVAPLRAQAETAAAAAEFAPEDHQRYADLLALYRHRGTLRSRMGAAAIAAARHALTDAYGAHLAAGGARTEAARQRIVQLGLTPDQQQLVDDIGDEAAALVTTQARGTVADSGLALGGLAHLGALAAGIANAPPPQPAAQRATTFATLLLDPAALGDPTTVNVDQLVALAGAAEIMQQLEPFRQTLLDGHSTPDMDAAAAEVDQVVRNSGQDAPGNVEDLRLAARWSAMVRQVQRPHVWRAGRKMRDAITRVQALPEQIAAADRPADAVTDGLLRDAQTRYEGLLSGIRTAIADPGGLKTSPKWPGSSPRRTTTRTRSPAPRRPRRSPCPALSKRTRAPWRRGSWLTPTQREGGRGGGPSRSCIASNPRRRSRTVRTSPSCGLPGRPRTTRCWSRSARAPAGERKPRGDWCSSAQSGPSST